MTVRRLVRRALPAGLPGLRQRPPVGWVRWGSLRRLEPIDRNWGENRGAPVDRFCIERFLDAHRDDVRGEAMSIGDDIYVQRYGGEQVTRSDVLNLVPEARATIVGDLADLPEVADGTYDCLVVVQTLHLIYDFRAAVATMHRVLRPGGVALVTVPGITPIRYGDSETWGEAWQYSFTRASMRRAFSEAFPGGEVEVGAHGNVVTAIAFQHGLAQQDLRRAELEHDDREHELVITVRAVKAGSAP